MNDSAQSKNLDLIKIISETNIDTNYLYENDKFLDEKIGFIAKNCSNVLDVGKCTRSRFSLFKPKQVTTVDINQYEGYPDVVDDLCNITKLKWGAYDGIICMSVIEHVYAPHLAVDNIHKLLSDDGYCLIHVPFLFRYHGTDDLSLQDYYRFSRDGLAYLFRDFNDVTIFPIRGSHSTIFNLFKFWKPKVEKYTGQSINKGIDTIARFFSRRDDKVRQASGYYLWAKK